MELVIHVEIRQKKIIIIQNKFSDIGNVEDDTTTSCFKSLNL